MAAIANGVGHDASENAQPPRPDPLVELLRVAEVMVATTREVLDKGLCRVQLRLHAWQTMLDSETSTWLYQARRSVKDGTAPTRASSREDILLAMEKSASQR